MYDTAFDALAHECRRTLLVDLMESNPQSAAGPRHAEGESGGLTDDRGLSPAMVHTHLPKLVDYGYARWDRAADEITTGPQFDELRPLLEVVRDNPEW